MLKRVIKKYVKMGGCQHLRDFRAAERLKTAELRKRIMERNKKHPEERQCSIQSNVPNIVHFFHLTFFKSYSPAPASRKKKKDVYQRFPGRENLFNLRRNGTITSPAARARTDFFFWSGDWGGSHLRYLRSKTDLLLILPLYLKITLFPLFHWSV